LFAPHPDDAHPDHIAVTRIAEDARFDAKLTNSPIAGEPIHPRRLIHYYCTHLKSVPSPTFAIDITRTAQRKRDAILAYRSQVVEHAPNRTLPDQVDAQPAPHEPIAGVERAEPFWCRELLGIDGIGSIL
jgi:LmbE family N-acetylglucosaminyl deacetylase